MNVTDTFINYLKKEDIHDYYCEKCNKNVLAEKKLYLYKLPKFLILVLKRYDFNGKLNECISYPLENMKIRETESGHIFTYTLYAVIYHHDIHKMVIIIVMLKLIIIGIL
jgi:ubiquitin C-terminal hydrolase